ncbi:MSCRAMM family protein [Fulvivirga imtechensis]|nr:carboxypeptidase-like regulatory domain-containing protein [Fulvivirga imtechensis]
MKRSLFFIVAFIIVSPILFFNCSKDDPKPSTGKLEGTVTDIETGSGIENVQIIVFDVESSLPTETTLSTDASGTFSGTFSPGTYYLKFFKQGYEAVPPRGIEAVAFSVEAGGTVSQSAEMSPSAVINGGFISGKAATGSAGVAGALIVAEDLANEKAYSTISDKDGNYSIYNIPQGSYEVKAYLLNYSSNVVSANLSANTETSGINIDLTEGASGSLTGTVRNLATDNKDVDVSLVHPITKETIPGLTTVSANLAYTISNIPDGTYIARATYKNDERVMDPDRIAKFGEPEVTFNAGGALTLTFDITGSIKLNTPTNDPSSTQPIEITSTTPTFAWTAYSSTSDYVIEVVDVATGNVIWGGLDYSGADPVKNIVIPSSQKTIQYNEDGNATMAELVPGRTYRWKVYASKNDQNSTTGWTLISSSEDQLGLIKVVE